MVSIIISVKNNMCNLKKTLISVLLQNCIEKVKIILVFNDNKTKKCYDDLINIFSEKISLDCLVADNKNLRQFGLDRCKTKYVIFLKANDFFYDAFSVDCLFKEIDQKKSNFAFGEYVELNGNYGYSNINNYYLSINGKIFLVDFLKKKKSEITDDNDFDVEFVGKTFLSTDKHCHIDNIVCVNNSFETDVLSNIKNIVDKTIEVYNLYADKLNKVELSKYVFYNFNYLNSLFVHNLFYITFEDFQKIITPLETLYRQLVKEV